MNMCIYIYIYIYSGHLLQEALARGIREHLGGRRGHPVDVFSTESSFGTHTCACTMVHVENKQKEWKCKPPGNAKCAPLFSADRMKWRRTTGR